MHMNQGEKLKLISVELGIMVDVFTYSDGGAGVTSGHKRDALELDRLARKMDKLARRMMRNNPGQAT